MEPPDQLGAPFLHRLTGGAHKFFHSRTNLRTISSARGGHHTYYL